MLEPAVSFSSYLSSSIKPSQYFLHGCHPTQQCTASVTHTHSFLQTTWASTVAVIRHTHRLHTPTLSGGRWAHITALGEGTPLFLVCSRPLLLLGSLSFGCLPLQLIHACICAWVCACVCVCVCVCRSTCQCVRHVTSRQSLHFNSLRIRVAWREGGRRESREQSWQTNDQLSCFSSHLVLKWFTNKASIYIMK